MKNILILFLFLFFFNKTFAQHRFYGRVVNESGAGVKSAAVYANDSLKAYTDINGSFSFIDSLSRLTLNVTRLSFDPKRIRIYADSSAIISLKYSIIIDGVIVTAFDRLRDIRKTPASVALLRQELNRTDKVSLVNVINTVPGVKMDERSPGSYRLSIRGNLLRSTFGVRNVKVYWNGIPFTDASGNTYLNQISPDVIDEIEIIKGPAGSVYGAGTGGVVLLKSADKNYDPVLHLNILAGNYGTFSGAANYRNKNASISFSHQQTDGYRVHTNMRRDVLHITNTFELSKKEFLHINSMYSDLYYQTPGGLTKAEMLANPRQARPAAGAFASAETQHAAIYLKTFYTGIGHEYRFSDKVKNTTSVYGSYTDFANPTIRNYEDKYERGIGARTVFNIDQKIFSHVLGAEYQHGFINTGVFGNRAGMKDTMQFHDEIRSRQYNIFWQTDVELFKLLTLSAGLSYNNFHYGYQRLSNVGSPKQRSDFRPQLAPRVSVNYAVNKCLYTFFAISKGYSPPSIDEVHASDGNFNLALNAETGMNYELGVKGDIIRNKLWGEMSYYIFGLENTIVSRRDASGADYYVNTGKTKQRGAELSLNYQPVRQLKIFVNYTNIHARFKNYQQGTNIFDGNKLTGTPPDVFVFGGDLNLRNGLYTNITYSYTSEIPLNDANTFLADAYSLGSIKIGYKTNLSKSIIGDFFSSGTFTFDKPYGLGNDLNAAGNRFYNPSAPVAISVGGRFSFGLRK